MIAFRVDQLEWIIGTNSTVLNDELNSNDGAYADCDLNKMNIFDTLQGKLYKGRRRVPPYITKEIDSINEKVAKTGRCDDLFKIPLMYWIPKMHKKVPKARFIAGSANVLITRLARVVNVLLSQVKKELKKLDKAHIAETGVKRCWFVDSYEEVVDWLQLLERPKSENQCINTYDFSTMYTTLDLSDLVSSVSRAIKEAYGDHHRYLLVTGNTQE